MARFWTSTHSVRRSVVSLCRNCAAQFEAVTKRAAYCSRLCKDRWLWRAAHPIIERLCPVCVGSMEGKRSHAVYCSRKCKTAGSDLRRNKDGRSGARNTARYAKERDRRTRYASEYLKRFPVKAKEFRLRRRARLRNAPTYQITERDWQQLLARHHFCCAYCGERPAQLQRDHVIPLSRGGHHRIGNILPACGPCNYRKKKRLLVEWRYGRVAA